MLKRVIIPVSCLVLLFVVIQSHSHSDEPPHLKYSKEVNEAAKEQPQAHVHSHSHEHHGCAHEHNGHEHSHEHTHSHSHHSDDGHHHSHEHHEHSHHHAESHTKSSSKKADTKSSVLYDKNGMFAFLNDPQTQLWVHSIGATVLISIFPFLILTFIPIQANTNENNSLLKVLLAFGAGGLIGDAFLHLIPHASMSGDHSHSHSHSHSHGSEEHGHVHDMFVGGWVITGFLTFFIVEKFMRIMRGDSAHGHSHAHAHHRPKPPKKAKSSDNETDDERSESDASNQRSRRGSKIQEHKDNEREELIADHHDGVKSGVAWLLNLVADMMHNFTDGLAIGASFIAGNTVGISTMVMVLVHEIPHEIGDFAILVQSGFSKRKAMFMQLLTALGALLGCLVSLWSVDPSALAEAAQSSWVLPFTAGGFIYIATVSVIPELLEKTTFWQSVVEVFFLCAGIFMMYLIALYE